jgi:hypothetical protein
MIMTTDFTFVFESAAGCAVLRRLSGDFGPLSHAWVGVSDLV